MAGRRPDFRITAVSKDKGPEGKKEYIDIFGAWQMELDNRTVEGVYGCRPSMLGKSDIYIVVVDEEGNERRIDADRFYFNLRSREADERSQNKTTTGNGKGRGQRRSTADADF